MATLKWGNQDNRYPPALWSGKSFLWVKLLNSGDLLKLQVPNCSWKTTSGWIYYSCGVISLNITSGHLNKAGGRGEGSFAPPRENEMENRGSKSYFKVIPKFVKEQRVNGSWCIKKPLMHLRCTLTGFERNYRIKILSNQIRFSLFREFSSKSFQSSIKNPALEIKSCALHPWFITGFVDASNNKSLIVWGTNLKSTVGYKLSPKELAKVQLAPYQYNVIIGLLLSDGWLIFGGARSKNARLGFAQSEDNGKYFWFVERSTFLMETLVRVSTQKLLMFVSLLFF